MTTLRPIDLSITESTINQVAIQSISWSKFKGPIPENPPYYAHIFWNIDYRYYFTDGGDRDWTPCVVARPYISGRSWRRDQFVSDRLLRHQYGHYLIGCLCALKFQEKVNKADNKFSSKAQAIKFCSTKFQQTLNEYLQIQKKYDEETDHFYNEEGQTRWQAWIANQINSMNPNYQGGESQMATLVGSSKSLRRTQESSGSRSRSRSGSRSREGRRLSTGKYQVQRVITGVSIIAIVAIFVYVKLQ